MQFGLIPWGEERQITRLRREMDRLFDRFFEGWPFRSVAEGGEWAPLADVSETGKDIIIKAELPGMDSKGIDISVQGGVLTIRGERKKEEEKKGEDFHRVERRYGTFMRSIQLPAEVDVDKVRAEYKNGVLSISLPKTKATAVKKIDIKSA